MSKRAVSLLFLIAALYDGVLGLVFLIAPDAVFAQAEVTPPNHMGYVRFPAALLVLFAWMFLRIARDPAGRRELILYGMGLKVCYVSVVLGYELGDGLPSMWLPFA